MVSTALIVTTLLGAVMVLPTGFCASAVGTTCGLNGICRAEADCAWARGKKNVEICGYTNTGRIVCCPGQRQSSVASTNPPQTHIEPRVGDLARRLCKHYVKYVMADEQALLNDTWSPELKAERCPNGLIPLISGGVEAKPQEYPHMALIGYGERDAVRYGCGGSLISTRFVLTAAHCSNTQNPAKWVLLGDLDFSRTDENSKPQMLAVKDQTFHDDYKPPAMYYDVLLLQLEGKVKMSNFVRPACLHTDTTWPDKNTTATGWGYQDHSSQMTTALQKVKLPVQPFRKCSEMFTASSLKVPHGLNKTIQLCAGDPSSPRKNICKGDSGGPLQLFSRNAPLSCMHIVVGVTSIGVECGQVALSVFTRVSSPVILRWIEKTLMNANKNN